MDKIFLNKQNKSELKLENLKIFKFWQSKEVYSRSNHKNLNNYKMHIKIQKEKKKYGKE